MKRSRRLRRAAELFGLGSVLMALSCGCDSPKPKTNPFETKKDTVEPPPIKEAPKLEGPPEFTVNAGGPKIGWTYILLDKPEGQKQLADEMTKNKKWVTGKEVRLQVTRDAKLTYVTQMVRALHQAEAPAVIVETDTRTEFPKAVRFVPESEAKSAPPCSVVTKVLSERKNAVWSLAGGTAVRSPKGLAGPDQSMTRDNVERAAKRCKNSDFVFVSADPDVEWGLVYDLAAVTQTLEEPKLRHAILLDQAPVAGRPVKLP